MLAQLQGLLLLDQVGQAVLHRQPILLVHLQLVRDPVAVIEGQDLLSQLVVARVLGSLVGHFLLGARVSLENFLPLIGARVGLLHWKVAGYLIDLLSSLYRDAQVQFRLRRVSCSRLVVAFLKRRSGGVFAQHGGLGFANVGDLLVKVGAVLFEFGDGTDNGASVHLVPPSRSRVVDQGAQFGRRAQMRPIDGVHGGQAGTLAGYGRRLHRVHLT